MIIGVYREAAIAIEIEASDPNVGNVCLFSARRVGLHHNVNYELDKQAVAREERNLHCDVHVNADNKRTLPPFGSLDSFWLMRSQ